jgi:hypothetical protein
MAQALTDLLVTWEAEYHSGQVLRERQGLKYGDIDRNALKEFRLVAPGEILVRAPMNEGRTGYNFCYRRRTSMSARQGEGFVRDTWFLLGFVPMGPVLAFHPQTLEVKQAPRFVPNDPLFYPPNPHPDEGELFTFDQVGHSTDARLTPSRIVLPSGYRMDVK